MKAISYWASRHIAASRFLLILLGVINFLSGVLIGINFWETTPLWFINLMGVGIVCSMVFIEKQYRKGKMTTNPNTAYQRRNKVLTGIYLCNFLLAIVFGQMLHNHTQRLDVQNPSYTTLKSAVVYNNTIPPVLVVKKPYKINKGALWIAKKVVKWQNKFTNEGSGKNINGLWMLILGILSAVASVPLACGLACGNIPALAIVVLLLGLGSLVGGIYFIAKYGVKSEAKSKGDERLQTALLIVGIVLIAGVVIALLVK